MSNSIDRRILIKDLLLLVGRSASSLASEIGLSRSNVTHWLKHGGSSVGIERQDELLENLGVSRGTLSPDKVHSWTLKTGELLPLARVLDWAGGRPYEIISLLPSPLISLNLKELTDCLTYPQLIRSLSPSIRISFRWRPPVFLPVTKIQQIDPVIVQTGLAKWRNIPKKNPASYPVIKVERSLLDKFEESEISIEDFDQVWNSVKTLDEGKLEGVSFAREDEAENAWTWEAVVTKAKKSGLTPREVAEKLGFYQ